MFRLQRTSTRPTRSYSRSATATTAGLPQVVSTARPASSFSRAPTASTIATKHGRLLNFSGSRTTGQPKVTSTVKHGRHRNPFIKTKSPANFEVTIESPLIAKVKMTVL